MRHPHAGDWISYEVGTSVSERISLSGITTDIAWTPVSELSDKNHAMISRIEFLQGPPTFRKDFRTGEVIGPIAGSRPENGAQPRTPWTWSKSRRHIARGIYPSGPESAYWSADNKGFVTGLWGRRTAIAVEATHPYRSPAPDVAAEAVLSDGNRVGLAVLDDITEPFSGGGFRTELVFDLPGDRHVRGTGVSITLQSEGASEIESLPLFGEEVPTWIVRWFRLSTPEYPAPEEIFPDLMMEYIDPYTPMADLRFGVAPDMMYEPTGGEAEGEVFDWIPTIRQVQMHQAKQACARETFIGVFDGSAPESQVYARVDDVPDQLVRTPLQRAIQLMKRNRDLHFNRPETVAYAPISIIITTLAAHLYRGEGDPYSALVAIAAGLQRHSALFDNRDIDPALTAMGLIQRQPDGRWYIANPVNPAENFADRWHEDGHARARALFAWVEALQTDLLNPPTDLDPWRFKEHLARALGAAAVAPHADILLPTVRDVAPRRRVHISSPAKPWRDR